MDLDQSIERLLQETGPGRCISTAAYDTAWVARLDELGEPVGGSALDWLRANQLADGSWGASEPRYYHDRLVSTLAAMTALARQGQREDRCRWQRARLALETIKNLVGHAIIKKGALRLSDAKEVLGYGRMGAVPVLDYLDQIGFTVRKGNTRILKETRPHETATL